MSGEGIHTLGRWARDRARATPDRIAIDYDGRLVTYGELDAGSNAWAARFHEAGLRRGDRVATLTGNTPEQVQVFFACAKAGLMLVPLSWRLAAPEIVYQLTDADPALLLVEDEYRDLAAATGWAFEELATAGRSGAESPDVPVSDADGLLLIYTSGTTGKPKGAVLTHGELLLDQPQPRSDDTDGRGRRRPPVLPQFHCGGWNVQPLLAWWKGACVVLERGFDPEHVLDLIERKRVTTTMGVPAIYLFLAQHPRFADADLSSLRRAVVGGAPMPESLLETWAARGIIVVQGYGLTEAAPNVLCLPPEHAARKLGFAGKPYPFVDVSLSDDSELLVRGPNVFPGYWRNPEATAATFTADGRLRTGDIAECDAEGFYRIKGRLKEMYISGGENVYPAEVEAVLHDHTRVSDAAVVGVPDERWGEIGAAYVVADGVTADELLSWCEARLARFKVPRSIHFLTEIPRNSMGKVQKQELREMELSR